MDATQETTFVVTRRWFCRRVFMPPNSGSAVCTGDVSSSVAVLPLMDVYRSGCVVFQRAFWAASSATFCRRFCSKNALVATILFRERNFQFPIRFFFQSRENARANISSLLFPRRSKEKKRSRKHHRSPKIDFDDPTTLTATIFA